MGWDGKGLCTLRLLTKGARYATRIDLQSVIDENKLEGEEKEVEGLKESFGALTGSENSKETPRNIFLIFPFLRFIRQMFFTMFSSRYAICFPPSYFSSCS